MLEFVCLPWSEVCSARVTSLLLLLLLCQGVCQGVCLGVCQGVARRSDNNMVKQLLFATRIPGHVQHIGRPCGTWMHYAMRDVKDMGQQMGYRSP